MDALEQAALKCVACHPCRVLGQTNANDAEGLPAAAWTHMSDELGNASLQAKANLQPRSLVWTKDYFDELVDHPEVEIEPGVKYEGQWKGTQCHGRGILRRKDGCCYEGEFWAGKPHGKGTFVGGNGSSYKGDWEQDKAHGYGVYNFADGSMYEGEWYQDEKNGRGRECWADGSRYDGQFLNGFRQGHGQYLDSKGRLVYEGQFRQDAMDGDGRYHFANGRIFIGQWRSGHINGKGTMQWPNKSRYRGHFICDVRHGEGTLEWPDGRKYSGQWRNGKQDGKGMVLDRDETCVAGLWKEGVQVETFELEEPANLLDSPIMSPRGEGEDGGQLTPWPPASCKADAVSSAVTRSAPSAPPDGLFSEDTLEEADL